ncbi:MAG: threonine/serine exporter family protein [Planctomycetes bacterium]|nr:threonine/serine exporter family protein [Planctomycetota bacterium]
MRSKAITTTILRPARAIADRLPRRTPPVPRPADGPDAERFLIDLGVALHRYGTSAPRLEGALSAVAATLGVPIQPLSTPTSLSLCFGGGTPNPRTHILRVEPADVDLGRLASLDELLDELAAGHLGPAQASRRLAELADAPARYPAVLVLLAFGVASAAAARFFGGGARDVLLSGLLGAGLGVLAALARRVEALARLFEPLAAALVSVAAVLAARHFGGTSDRLVTLAALIVLVPGFTLTVGLSELALRHQVSGTARLAAAGSSFLALGLGVALGRGLAGEPPLSVPGAPLPGWTEWIALGLSPLAFAVLLSARARDVPWVLLAGVLAYLGARQGAAALGPELGALVGALLVGLAGNLASHVLRRPPSVVQVPGLLLLVPGSMGFRSVSSFVSRDTVGGLETAFGMAFVAAGLVGGLLLAYALLPPRRAL